MSAASNSSPLPIVIAGAGLAGCMCTLLLAREYERAGVVQPLILLEHREDFRKQDREDAEGGRMANAVKRSINLALSHRGICALKAAGIPVGSAEIIPMHGRLMHDLAGRITSQPYGTDDQAIYSVSRRGLNELLLNELDKLGSSRVDIRHECKVTRVTKDGHCFYTTPDGTTHEIAAKAVIGADGAYSRVRESMRHFTRMDCSMQYIRHGYKELTIPPKVLADGSVEYAMQPWQGLHIWPRDQFMLIALPNPDKSFTCTLFFPFEGPESLEGIESDEDILNYFRRFFPDVIPLMPDFINNFRQSPNSALLQMRCDPYHSPGGRVCILGDAAHAVVPFYGQGMNAAFEDCLILAEIMREAGIQMDIQKALPEFSRRRVAAGQALAELSYENYIEMRHHTASRFFLLRKRLEAVIHKVCPSWIPQYTMVAFTRIPYDEAIRRAQRQDRILKAATIIAAGVGTMAAAAAGVWAWMRKNKPHMLPTVTITWPTPQTSSSGSNTSLRM